MGDRSFQVEVVVRRDERERGERDPRRSFSVSAPTVDRASTAARVALEERGSRVLRVSGAPGGLVAVVLEGGSPPRPALVAGGVVTSGGRRAR